MQGVNLCPELHLNVINLAKFPQAVCKNLAKTFITHGRTDGRTDTQTTAKHNAMPRAVDRWQKHKNTD